jgi:hypothetical protein
MRELQAGHEQVHHLGDLAGGCDRAPRLDEKLPVNGNGRASEPTTVYVDAFTGALFLDKPTEVERYHTAFANIWAAAVDEAASRELIAKAAEEFKQ